jgi:plastocyanin domain-containing protein
MPVSKLLAVPPLALLALAAKPALACDDCPSKAHAVTVAAADQAPAAGTAKKGVRTIEIAVTPDGFTPAEITAKAGETVKLVVTRKVEKTCATEIVMKDFGVNQPLPLAKPVTVTVKPAKPGTYRFACGMDMIAGTLKVE